MNTEVAERKIHPLEVKRRMFEARLPELRKMLPAHIPAERFARVVLTAYQRNPDLFACTDLSVWNSCMAAANDGLLPDGEEGAIVPFGDKAQWMRMYRGLLKKFRNSGQAKWLTANIVYKGEEYQHWIDENGEHFKHVPGDEIEDRPLDDVRRVYAIATTKDGGFFVEDLSVGEIKKIQAVSKTRRGDSPWNTWWKEMAKKTAIRRLSKHLPMSSDLDDLMRGEDDALYDFKGTADRRESPPARLVGAQAALEHFGASEQSAASSQPTRNPGAEAEKGAPAASGPSPDTTAGERGAPTKSDIETRAAEDGADPSAKAQSAPQPSHDKPGGELFEHAVATATQRGWEAHKTGQARKAMPGEYRDQKRAEEADAWLLGWDRFAESEKR
jgi:recombination protein RecT